MSVNLSSQATTNRIHSGQAPTKRQFNISGDGAGVARAGRAILDCIHAHGFDETEAFEIVLCLEEAIKNAIRHGSRHNPAKRIRVDVWHDDARIHMRVTDQGDGFDHRHRLSPITRDEPKIGTTGLWLIHNLMTGIRYNAKGNSIELWKSRSRQKARRRKELKWAPWRH